MWKNHPKGLAVLFFTEMWERFGYYTMLSLLALYMDEHFQLSKPVIGQIYGIFLALSYFTPILGGLIADRWLGLISSYAVVTLAEICLSPMGLSLANKLSPPRMRGLMMGCWFGATSIGKYLAGFVGGYWEKLPHSRFFGMLVILSIVAVFLMLMAKKKINSALDKRA